MPIVISRKTGERLSEPVLTPEQKNRLWEAYVNAYIDRHPELFTEEAQPDDRI